MEDIIMEKSIECIALLAFNLGRYGDFTKAYKDNKLPPEAHKTVGMCIQKCVQLEKLSPGATETIVNNLESIFSDIKI